MCKIINTFTVHSSSSISSSSSTNFIATQVLKQNFRAALFNVGQINTVFDHVTSDVLRTFKVKCQRSRSQCKKVLAKLLLLFYEIGDAETDGVVRPKKWSKWVNFRLINLTLANTVTTDFYYYNFVSVHLACDVRILVNCTEKIRLQPETKNSNTVLSINNVFLNFIRPIVKHTCRNSGVKVKSWRKQRQRR